MSNHPGQETMHILLKEELGNSYSEDKEYGLVHPRNRQRHEAQGKKCVIPKFELGDEIFCVMEHPAPAPAPAPAPIAAKQPAKQPAKPKGPAYRKRGAGR